MRLKTDFNFRTEKILDKSRIFIFLLGCDSPRTWNDNPQTVLPSHATNAIHLGQSTSFDRDFESRITVTNVRPPFLHLFFPPFSPFYVSRVGNRKDGGRKWRERKGAELISYREASRKRRRRRLAVSRKKRNALKTLSRAIFSEWRGGEEGGHSTFEWNCSDGGRGGGRRRKLIRRKAVPGGISFEFSEHRGNSVSVTFSFYLFLASWI